MLSQSLFIIYKYYLSNYKTTFIINERYKYQYIFGNTNFYFSDSDIGRVIVFRNSRMDEHQLFVNSSLYMLYFIRIELVNSHEINLSCLMWSNYEDIISNLNSEKLEFQKKGIMFISRESPISTRV